MLKKIGLGVLVVLIAFVVYVSTRDGKFNYSRKGVINATPAEIYPYISNFRLGEKWSPYEQVDPTMKKTFSGPDGQPGSKMEFEGNSDAGSGHLEILNTVENHMVEIKLTMTKPFHAENLIQYTLVPNEGGDTTFTWSMSGDGGFLGKLMTVLIDCEKMIGDQFTQGISNLKTVVESSKQ